MAIVLKSNARLNPSVTPVGNLHGYSGPSDYRAMLDFTHQRYLLDGQHLSFSQALSFTRTSTGSYLDVFGRTKIAPANMPRFNHIPESLEAGLLLETSLTNYVTAQTNGAAFSAPASSAKIVLSWSGTGTVSLVAAGVTLGATSVEGARTHRFYTRSGAISGTISITGDVYNIMIANSNSATSYVKYGTPLAEDNLTLSPATLALISGGAGTILCRYVYLADGGLTNRLMHPVVLYNGTAPRGGLLASTEHKYAGLSTGEVKVFSDGAAVNIGTQVARNLGNKPLVGVIAGIYFSGFGAQAGIISHGQAGRGAAATAGVTPPTAFTGAYFGRAPLGMLSAALNPGAILTHCVIYDRMVTDDEAFDMAVGWAA